MFWAKAILPLLLWTGLLWFLVTGHIHLPIYGLVERKEQTSLYLFLVLLDLALALTFTRMLLGPT